MYSCEKILVMIENECSTSLAKDGLEANLSSFKKIIDFFLYSDIVWLKQYFLLIEDKHFHIWDFHKREVVVEISLDGW